MAIGLTAVSAFFLTIIIGPLAFFIMSRHAKKGLSRYPAGLIDGVGDIFFLPAYNAIIIEKGVFLGAKLAFGFGAALAILVFYVMIDMRLDYADWSKPKRDKYGLGGYYHLAFLFIQSAVICYGLIEYGFFSFASVPLAAYVLLVIAQLLLKKHW